MGEEESVRYVGHTLNVVFVMERIDDVVIVIGILQSVFDADSELPFLEVSPLKADLDHINPRFVFTDSLFDGAAQLRSRR